MSLLTISARDEGIVEFAVQDCRIPFAIAVDFGDEWEILKKGVCYHLDFVPTPEQIDSGFVPCP